MARSRVAIIDDDPMLVEMLAELLTGVGHDVVTCRSGEEGVRRLTTELFDIALVDVAMPNVGGLDVLRTVRQHDSAIEVLLMTGHPDVGTAVQALREGATDYLVKPFNPDELLHRLNRAMERRLLRGEVSTLRQRLTDRVTSAELVGHAPAMAALKELIAKVAPTKASVLIEGESGTGKELVAVALHRLSPRGGGPFIPVNCGAIPAELMESELFGHARGAFSGAVADTLGLFRSADGGSIFLDEIAELPHGAQAKLLRVLQNQDVRPVGSSKTHAVDVRVIAATNRRLDDAIKQGTFRDDLFYRLNVIRIVVPSLRDRKADIPVLATHFLRRLNQRFGRDVRGVHPAAMSALMAYDFPGNVRELENVLERAYALGAVGAITRADLPALAPSGTVDSPPETLPTLADVERNLIVRALRQYRGDKVRAARALGISHRTLYRRLDEYRLR